MPLFVNSETKMPIPELPGLDSTLGKTKRALLGGLSPSVLAIVALVVSAAVALVVVLL